MSRRSSSLALKMESVLGKLPVEYVGLGDDGHLHPYADQRASAREFPRRLHKALSGYSVYPDDCAHDRRKVFNGFVWHCEECGSIL